MSKQKPAFKPTMSWLLKNPICFLGFGFGTGLGPKAPGTFGTLPALPIVALFVLLGFSPWLIVIIAVLFFIVGVPICNITEERLGVHDYGGIVWDEIAAMILVLAYVPMSWFNWTLAFVIFRFYDAVKPWPISWFDKKLPGGLGVMVDDTIAAFFSMATLYIIFKWLL